MFVLKAQVPAEYLLLNLFNMREASAPAHLNAVGELVRDVHPLEVRPVQETCSV